MNSSPPSLLSRYRYDPLDRLTSHVQSSTPQRHRFYCKSRLATEIQGAIGYSIVQHGDLLLAQQQGESGSPDTTLLATDLQRSVLHTLKKNAGRQPIAYSPYGHRSVENGLSSLLGFNGERPEPGTENYLLGNGYRAFNTFLMRFNSPDSLSPFGKGGLNSYTYCLGDPANKTDSNGHSAVSLLSRIAMEKVARRLRIKRTLPRRQQITPPPYSITPTARSGPEVVFQPESKSATKTVKLTVNAEGDWYEFTELSSTKRDSTRTYLSARGGIQGSETAYMLTRNDTFHVKHNGIITQIPSDNFHTVEYGFLTMEDFVNNRLSWGKIVPTPYDEKYYPGFTTLTLSEWFDQIRKI